jgi:sulfate permease, SulP family
VVNAPQNNSTVLSRFTANWTHTLTTAGIMALLGVLFSALYSAFIFAGPLVKFVLPSVGVLLWGTAIMMLLTVLFSGFRGVYAVIQDEAVVILSVVATAIVTDMGGLATDRAYYTILGAIAASTIFTGFAFYLLGILRLGRIIRYIPFSVTAGFMITIGWLLIVGSFEVAEGKDIHLILLDSVQNGSLAWKAAVAMLFAALLSLLARRWGDVLALPLSFAIGIAVFYTVGELSGNSFSELGEMGWLLILDDQVMPSNSFWHGIPEIDWAIVLEQWRSFVSIAVISALGLLLAVTGLELSTKSRVDVDRELRASGIANLSAGMGGSVAGYADIAVTTMLHQGDGTSRRSVIIASLICVGVALSDMNWLSYLPLPFLGGVFLWLGWQLWEEWLFKHGDYLQSKDWIAVGAIVFVTVTAGFVAGVLLGVGVGIALFLLDYSQVRAIRYIVNGREIRSNVDRPPAMEQYLYDQGRRIHIIKLQGYLFFARSHQVLVQLEPYFAQMSAGNLHYVLVDFKGVAGIDSTATMGFVRLRQMAIEAGGELVFSGLSEEAKVDLSKNELSQDVIKYFDNLDQGLSYCEDQILVGQDHLRTEKVSAAEIFADIINVSPEMVEAGNYLKELCIPKGQRVIEIGDPASDIFIVESGSLSVQTSGLEGKPIILRGLEPGSVFGEMAVYLGGARSASVVADSEVMVSKLSAESLAQMERENPMLAMAVHKLLAKLLATKLRQTNTWLSHLE